MAEGSQRPAAIKPHHLVRRAALYLRQSSVKQVLENEGSTQHQRDQGDFPRLWGWPSERIEVIDEDLGRSGSTSIRRPGYRRLLQMVTEGQVGAVFVSYLDRLGRNARESVVFLDECRTHNVLLVPDGRVLDVRQPGEYFQAFLLLGVAELENSGRRANLYNGKLAKAKLGQAVSPPPVGYVSQRGAWIKDPDESVRMTIEAVFAIYREERSLPRTVAKMVTRGIKLPRRDGHTVYWVAPNVGAVSFMLTSPAYMGDYVFRKRRTDLSLGRSPNGRLRDRVATEDEVVVCADHHDAYVTREHFAEIRQIMDLNRPTKERRNLGPGSGILQGVLRCATHACAMGPRYKVRKDGTKHHCYRCEGDTWKGGGRCTTAPSRGLEEAVTGEIARRLAPPSLEVIRRAWSEAQKALAGEDERRHSEGERLRRVLKDLKRRYFEANPDNRRFLVELETKIECALRDLEEFETKSSPTQVPAVVEFSDDAFAELVAVCGNFEELWNAPTTRYRDRKEIIRTMIRSVTVDMQNEEEIQGRIAWADGAPDTEITVKLGGYSTRLIRELSNQGIPAAEIAARLNAGGTTTLKRTPWTEKTIKMRLWKFRTEEARTIAKEKLSTSASRSTAHSA